MENQENKLKCKPSQFKTEMSFNEWAEKYNVGRGYVPPTKKQSTNGAKELANKKLIVFPVRHLVVVPNCITLLRNIF